MTSVLQDSLSTECPDSIQNYQSILNLNDFYARTQSTYSPLLLKISGQISVWKDSPIFGEYLIEMLETARQGNEYFELKDPLQQAKWFMALGAYWSAAQSDRFGGLEYYEKALSLANRCGSPTVVGQRALCMISQVLTITGSLHDAQKHAARAQEYAEALGGLYSQAHALYLQARCQVMFANFSKAQMLHKEAAWLVISCGLEGCTLHSHLQMLAAELHLLKTEYLESRHIEVSTAATMKEIVYNSILANLNIALIDIASGIESQLIKKNLDQCQRHCGLLYGFLKADLECVTDHRFAELFLRDGDLGTANVIFTRSFAWSEKSDTEVATACLERLADISTGMNDIHTTIAWAGIFLVIALRSKNKLATMKAFCCLGQIFSVQKDGETALSLFNVALDGFTFMDVHQWRANCMVQIGDIWKSRGEVLRAVGLWKAARPLFQRSSQAKDMAQIDTKLAMVKASILEHKKQLLQLPELNLPAATNLEKTQDPTSEEEDDELVGGEHKSLQISV
ncbi:hypothetical protein C8J57DRAFT_1230941 [Mycena rebaudengoi]|nr:hypothetical protein C8J57DRAFT_1230941 [Mycena rebaudengoi]